MIAFALGFLSPGDPAVEALSQGPYDTPDPRAVAALRREWGLDQPAPVQYVKWLQRCLQGDLGTSYFSRHPVSEELFRRLPATLLLAFSATALATVIGISTGLISALWAKGWVDGIFRLSSVIFASLPGFLIGILLITVFAEHFRLLPTSGYGRLAHLILPALALSIGESARILRLTRTQLLVVLSQEYIRTARGKGLSSSTIAIRHALPNAMLNVLTALGLHLGEILGGAAVIETIFAWPGIGRLAVESINRRDYPMVQGFVLLSGGLFIGINLLVDLLYRALDPRVELS
jgi:peptide/nickel transport system permease protein